MNFFDLFGGGSATTDPVGPSGGTVFGDTTSYFTLPDFTQPTNYVSLSSSPSYTAPDAGGFFSSVGSLFSNTGTGIANASSSAWNSVSNLFGGSSAPNSSQNTAATGSGTGLFSTVGSIFTGIEKAVGIGLSAAGTSIKSGANRTASFGGGVLGNFIKGVVGGAGIPTLLVVLAIVGVVAYVWAKRI